MPNIIALNSIFEQDPLKIKKLKKEKLLYIISFVYNLQIRNYESDYENDGFAVTICTKMFEKILAKKYKAYFKYLCDNNILELVSNHFAGVTCRKYCLTDQFTIAPSFYTITGFTFSKTLGRLAKKKTKNNKKYYYLEKWLTKIDFDVESATVFNNLLFESRKNYQPFQTISKKNRKRLSNPHNQYTNGQISILKMQNKDNSVLVDDKGMRLHTRLTKCPKLLRNYISVNGQNLVSIDIKNSQPYMLLALLEPNNFKKMRTDHKPYLTILTSPPSLSYKIPSIIFRHSSKILTSKGFQKYKKMVTNGSLYDEFVKMIKIDPKEIKSGFSARDIVKFRFMLCFYSSNGSNSNGMKSVFRSEFPEIYALICDLKQKDHRALSILLQKVESTLVLDKICGKISKEYPKIPLFTIHDSILTTQEYVNYVISIIEKECEKYIGVSPKLTIEQCSPKINKKLLEEMDKELM